MKWLKSVKVIFSRFKLNLAEQNTNEFPLYCFPFKCYFLITLFFITVGVDRFDAMQILKKPLFYVDHDYLEKEIKT